MELPLHRLLVYMGHALSQPPKSAGVILAHIPPKTSLDATCNHGTRVRSSLRERSVGGSESFCERLCSSESTRLESETCILREYGWVCPATPGKPTIPDQRKAAALARRS